MGRNTVETHGNASLHPGRKGMERSRMVKVVDTVIRYIQNQEAHYHKETFPEEYRRFLTAFEVEWEEAYIFKELQ